MSTTFGTDGIRGVANSQLRPELALALGRCAARHLGETSFLVGRDTRRSGPMLAGALCAGITSEGFDVIDLGIVPTPALAWLGARRGLPVVMISASHNPFADNGIKLFGPGGAKLTTDVERAIERDLQILLAGDEVSLFPVPVGRELGAVTLDPLEIEGYVDELNSSIELARPSEIHVVVDCANGAASMVAPEVFRRLGVNAHLIANTPDGTNINEHCGATSPALLAQTVLREGADLGVAFDGDADRLIAVDNLGSIIDGDVLIALFASDLAARGLLHRNEVAVTIMSNLGLRRALGARGISLVETQVGDRNVTDAMESRGITLGGEQSGHIVFRRSSLIGDGIYSALRLLEIIDRSTESAAELAQSAMQRIPQLIRNVAVGDVRSLASQTKIFERARELESELGEWGRVLIRASGTEPKVRVMVEAENESRVHEVVEELTLLVEHEMGLD
jgi:phosphoglucosamine mutase